MRAGEKRRSVVRIGEAQGVHVAFIKLTIHLSAATGTIPAYGKAGVGLLLISWNN
jgi:hypothetical protein